MTATEPVWKEVTWYRSPEFDDESAMGCYLAKVFCYHTDRNAWWSTPTGEIRGYALKRKPLEDNIQAERTQGTRFNISELPAIAIMGKTHDLVVFEFGGDPFKETRDLAIDGRTLQELGASIRSAAPHLFAYKTFLSSRGFPPIPILPFKAYESYPRAADMRLGWKVLNRRTPDITHISSLVSRVCLHLNGQT